MSTVRRGSPTRTAPATTVGPGLRRVRQQARDAVVVMALSAATSTALVGGLLLVLSVGR
ncbi:hypothetical protein [Nocardioides lentus]|uniref:hypothetical protein n=1 Tax=Nocardioides lentus TaxID=338077 RepID=UPI0031DDE089